MKTEIKKNTNKKSELKTSEVDKKIQSNIHRDKSKKIIEELEAKNKEIKLQKHIEKTEKQKKTEKNTIIHNRFDKKKKSKFDVKKGLNEFLEKSGYEGDIRSFHKKIVLFNLITIGVVQLALIIIGIAIPLPFVQLFVLTLLLWTLGLITLYLSSLISVFFFTDMKMYQRTKQVEEVLPDFLQLTSANISAGMPIDRALWLAVRPRFGILSKEIEEIAKATIAGEDLEKALITFSKKYDSKILRESVNLLNAGLAAGGEVAELLNKISINIQESKLMAKEIAANVMTYVIFIGVATIAAAPFLFALSGQLLATTQSITSNIEMDSSSAGSSFSSFNFDGEGISLAHFNSFAILMQIISSIFSVAIISTIRKGNFKDGIKLIPVFIGVSLAIYFVSSIIFQSVLGGFF